MPLAPGHVFAGYEVIRSLGTGGMGAVYLVRHPRLPRTDAMKVLRPEFSGESDFAERFRREADLASRLSHRNIVTVFDRGEEDLRLWLTMQYVAGVDAETALDEAGGLFPAERATRVVSAVAAALDHAHANDLVHRDVKPANILLAPGPDEDEPERVFLTDFGIAKALDGATPLTRTGAVLATFDYASPEQIESHALDARSDIYSLGCVLYRMLTGSVPFPGYSMAAAIHGHLNLPPPRPSALVPWLPPGLDDVVERAMAKRPEERFATCRDLAMSARQALWDLPPAPDPPFRFTLSQEVAGATTVTGPVSTDEMAQPEAQQLVDMVRRMRFFDLPDTLPVPRGSPDSPPAGAGAPRRVTLEVRAPEVVRRVSLDLASAHRPPDVDDLLAAVCGFTATVDPPAHPPAPATVISETVVDVGAAQTATAASAVPVTAGPAETPVEPQPPAGLTADKNVASDPNRDGQPPAPSAERPRVSGPLPGNRTRAKRRWLLGAAAVTTALVISSLALYFFGGGNPTYRRQPSDHNAYLDLISRLPDAVAETCGKPVAAYYTDDDGDPVYARATANCNPTEPGPIAQFQFSIWDSPAMAEAAFEDSVYYLGATDGDCTTAPPPDGPGFVDRWSNGDRTATVTCDVSTTSGPTITSYMDGSTITNETRGFGDSTDYPALWDETVAVLRNTR